MNEYYCIIIYFILIVLSIFCYGIYRCKNKNYNSINDPLMTKLGIFDLDGWSISHYLTFLICSYIYPDKWCLLIILGIVWELIEDFLGSKYGKKFAVGVGECNISTDPKEVWWYGRYSDIIVNTLGVITGICLNKKLKY